MKRPGRDREFGKFVKEQLALYGTTATDKIDEYRVQLVLQSCHNLIWEKEGYDPARAFDEFSKVLFSKCLDEKLPATERVFAPRRFRSHREFAQAIRDLFSSAVANPNFSDIFAGAQIDLDDFTISKVAEKLSSLPISPFTSSLDSAELKGTIYETFIGNTFRGELGQFFTHRKLVQFMIRMLDIKPTDVIYDPACGSGGFLVQALKYIHDAHFAKLYAGDDLERAVFEYSKIHLFGTEINDRAARTAKLNLLMHGGFHKGIVCTNALLADHLAPGHFLSKIAPGPVDVIFANPPFAGFERDPSVLARFTLGRNASGEPTSVTREVLFIEKIVSLLRAGGKAAIVIPQGIFTNRSLRRVRDFIRAHSRILAVIELPDWAFIPSGTSVRGSLLFLERSPSPPHSYRLFMKRVEHVGYTSTGRVDPTNELETVLDEYVAGDGPSFVPIDRISHRLDAKFYQPENRKVITLFERARSFPLVPLARVGSFQTERYNPKRQPDREILCVETSSVEPEALSIHPSRLLGKDSNYSSLKVLHAGDILISRRRPYRAAIVRVPDHLDGAMAITEFSVLRVTERFDPDYVLEILRSPSFVKLMTIYSTGEMSGRISESDLRRLKIPCPPLEEQKRLAAAARGLRRKISAYQQEIALCRKAIADRVEALIRGERPSGSR